MNSAQINELYSYNNWANEKLLEFVGTLDLADFTRNLSNSFSSIRDTVVHGPTLPISLHNEVEQILQNVYFP